MPLKFHHVHLKARDPEKTAAWYQRAFGFTIVDRPKRPTGDIFLICKMVDGTTVMISGEKTGETLPAGSAAPRLGLEHFAVTTDDFDRDFSGLQSHGATVLEDPVTTAAGIRVAFLQGPDDVRIELMYFPPK